MVNYQVKLIVTKICDHCNDPAIYEIWRGVEIVAQLCEKHKNAFIMEQL